jgi:hypothetical protein
MTLMDMIKYDLEVVNEPNSNNYKHTELTQVIIKSFYKVYNTLGFGFLEKVYENALFIELKNAGLFVEKQRQIKVYYVRRKVFTNKS